MHLTFVRDLLVIDQEVAAIIVPVGAQKKPAATELGAMKTVWKRKAPTKLVAMKTVMEAVTPKKKPATRSVAMNADTKVSPTVSR